MLFDKPLARNFEADSRSDLTFYDIGCVDDSEDSPAISTTVTATRSTFSYVRTMHSTATRTTTRVSFPTVTPIESANGTKSTPAKSTESSTLLPTQIANATMNADDGEEIEDAESAESDINDEDPPETTTTPIYGTGFNVTSSSGFRWSNSTAASSDVSSNSAITVDSADAAVSGAMSSLGVGLVNLTAISDKNSSDTSTAAI
ncbi:unnamed protein product [Discula destructiva]